MARVMVLGGGGFIGARVAAALQRLGHDAFAVSRHGARYSADRNAPDTVARLARRERCDVLVDMIAYEAKSTSALYDALKGLTERHLLVSSADVYRNYAGLHRLERCEPIAGALTEKAPLRTRLYPYRGAEPRREDAPDAWMDSYDKILVERVAAGGDTTIMRLPMVYGPGDRNQRFAWIAAPMAHGADVLRAPATWLSWVTTYGYVDNVAHALALAATHPLAAGQTYNCGEPAVDHHEWIKRFGLAAGWQGRVEADEHAPLAAAIAALDPRFHLALDTSRIRAELGYAEVVDEESAIRSLLYA